ncbi:opine metallophore biosynthesis dehydrogenase [Glutamicibacter sp.]|uniref:opine metallophore biosynthesis dehydrogenase n=1 Tax=Glutamicibacter sp. TaxID=1931995 RepID=UPI0028BEE2D1|nr:opine metallophore biosynthesis dehydrogenase [Glutamicibacter sp.]
MNELGSILIAGTGPTAVQMSVLLGRLRGTVGLVGRSTRRSQQFFQDLSDADGFLTATVQNAAHQALAGQQRIEHRFIDFETVSGEWKTLVLTVPANAYLPVLRRMPAAVLERIERVVLLSPTLGSGALVHEYLNSRALPVEVISLSSYLGDSRWPEAKPGITVLTTGVKARIYSGSTLHNSQSLQYLRTLFESVGTDLQLVDLPLDAEARNISLYVHPALFMNDVSLNAVFNPSGPQQFVYKLYPEGPITPTLIHCMVDYWRELTNLVRALGGSGINLLEFMLADGYRIRPESIAAELVSSFESLAPIHQEYLVYVRYASLLIDPYSAPDAAGRYFDFSAIPIRPIFVDESGHWDIPRMPKEDYYRTKIIQGFAQKLSVDCPTIDKLVGNYESVLQRSAGQLGAQPKTSAFEPQEFSEDLSIALTKAGVKA